MTFNKLIEKYKIEYINKLIIDTEGFDYKIIKSINFKKIFIKEIMFEKKHLSKTFQIDNKLDEIKTFLSKENYELFDISDENILAKNISEPTTDKYLYETALNNQIIIDKFLLMLMETSVDCFIHRSNVNKDLQKKINCKVCRPTNKPLYYDILSDDINLQNNCIEVYGDRYLFNNKGLSQETVKKCIEMKMKKVEIQKIIRLIEEVRMAGTDKIRLINF